MEPTDKVYKWAGLAVTLALIGVGIHIFLKNKDRDGFWWGVLALLLVSSSLKISEIRKV
jgi:hypothetical protein